MALERSERVRPIGIRMTDRRARHAVSVHVHQAETLKVFETFRVFVASPQNLTNQLIRGITHQSLSTLESLT